MKRAAAGVMLALSLGAGAQEIRLGDMPASNAKRQHVELLDEAVHVTAGRPQEIELRFRVGAGLHINSHTPKDETLLPTVLKVKQRPEGELARVDYPAGVPFRLNIGAGETLDTYQGEFRVRVHVQAPAGESELTGELRYQACDSASCFPPRSLPVKVAVSAR